MQSRTASPPGKLMTDETDIRQTLAAGALRVAFEMIVDRFQEKVFHLALSMTHNEATARDLAQDAFVRIWKALPGYNGTASLSTWIYTITRNVCLTELARSKRRQTVSLDASESTDALEHLIAPEPTDTMASHDIAPILARLPEKFRRVLELFYLEQKSYDETAALLGVPLGTVKVHLFRARKELVRIASEERALAPLITNARL